MVVGGCMVGGCMPAWEDLVGMAEVVDKVVAVVEVDLDEVEELGGWIFELVLRR